MNDAQKAMPWRLTVECNSLKDQANEPYNEPAYFPLDAVSRIYAYLGEHWGLLPEELDEMTTIRNGHSAIDVYTDTIDSLTEVTYFVMMATLFNSMTITRRVELDD